MIFNKYVLGDISINKKSYISTIITIFLAVVILSTFIFGVSSYYKSYRDLIANTTGGYHFRIVNEISKNDALSLKNNRNINKLGLFNTSIIDESFGSKPKLMLFRMDENSLSTLSSWIKEGSLPKEGEVMISNDMSREINKNINDLITIDNKTYPISGIYYDITYEFHELYNVYLNINQDKLLEEYDEFIPFIWYKNIFKTYYLSEEIMENLDADNITYNYNSIFLDRSFVFDPDDDLLKDHTFQVSIIVLFFVLIILFFIIIKNLFLVQESKSVKEYSKLKSIGATNKDIKKIITLKSLYLSQIPIVLGIVSSMGIVSILFSVINKVEEYFSASKGILKSNLNINFYSSIKFIIFIYIISTLVIYLATKTPIKKLKNNSILSGLKGDIKSKSYKKYDLISTGDIEKDLAKQFYKNSKKNFISSGLTLKAGFLLMSFILILITYLSMEEKFNSVNKFNTYNIQGRFATLAPINDDFLEDIYSLNPNEVVNYRNEYVYLDYSDDLVDDAFLSSGSLSNLEEEIVSLDNISINIIGVDDKSFNKFALDNNLDPNNFKDNKVILLNTIGNRFDLPISKVEDMKFLKDDVNSLSVSEYGPVLQSRGYEFELDIENKIYKPLFDYPLSKNKLNCYMPKSEYIKLFNKFEKIADLDQFEYILINSDETVKFQDELKNISLNYFKDGDFQLKSQVDVENLIQKRAVLGNILAIFFSIFFIIIGFSNSYFAFYNLFLSRKDDLVLYKKIGIDNNLLSNILKREKNKIIFNFIFSMPILLIILSFIISSSSKVFSIFDILSNINYIFILAYILIIYVSITIMYNNYKKDIL